MSRICLETALGNLGFNRSSLLPAAMPKIFLSYRRSDSEDIAGRIYDRLVADFGKGSLFFDVDTIPFGIDFREFLQGEVQQCQVLIAIIGPTWLSTTDDDGHRRIDNTADWVRIEIESALARDIPVIPLLVRGARLPKATELPASLQALAYRNAATARAGRDFHRDMDVLIRGIETLIERFITPTFKFEVVTVNAQGRVVNTTAKTAEYFREDLGNSVTLDLVRIPAGQFLMGSPDSEKGEGPQHRVSVPEFWLGKYPVTQDQYQAIMGKNPSRFSENGANRPVEQVSWHDAVAFCQKLSQQTGRPYRLPSEAEWEYACRAGTTTPFHVGPTITTDLANYNGNFTYGAGPTGVYREQTTEVGSFPANAFGLYDMHGNVWEWCADHWHDSYEGAPVDGSAWLASGEGENPRILRGGSWGGNPVRCRSAFRSGFAPDLINGNVGFRVVCGGAGT
ncbi:MAG: TIR domain-containing protein [Leptolyngbya sp. LCM1.Bin17]|nr:MAG: TIR domain-containing protein [Leptolyngbya sp. LCM1.Bin17]